MSTLTTSDLLNWMNASASTSAYEAATPNSDSLIQLQACLDSAISSVESYCDLPETYPVAVEQAIKMLAVRLWDRRKTPNGLAMGDYGVVRVGAYDADIEALLAPYRRWGFGA